MRDVYQVLRDHNIEYKTYEHPAVFTVAEAEIYCKDIPGKHVKNLFLKNDKGDRHYLVTVAHDKRADLKQLAQLIGEKRLGFASPERLRKYLGLTPGSVSPLGLINDEQKSVRFLVDSEILAEEKIFIHPNINTATLAINTTDFKRLLKALGYEIQPLQI